MQPPVFGFGGCVAAVSRNCIDHSTCTCHGMCGILTRCWRVEIFHRSLENLNGVGGSLVSAHVPLRPSQTKALAQVGPGRHARPGPKLRKFGVLCLSDGA